MSRALRTANSNPLQRFNNWFDNEFNRFMMPSFANWMQEMKADLEEWRPQTDISETDSEIKIVANLPGLKKEDVKIEYDQDSRVLTLQGEYTKESKKDDETFHRMERSFGKFERSVKLPANAEPDKISASMKDGVLYVGVPKSEVKKERRQISIA